MVKKEAAPQATRPKSGDKSQATESKSQIDEAYYQRNLFLVMVMDMTWQLAVVVLVPIIGGYYLDHYFHTFPGLFIAGFVLAAIGVIGVLIKVINKATKKAGFKK